MSIKHLQKSLGQFKTKLDDGRWILRSPCQSEKCPLAKATCYSTCAFDGRDREIFEYDIIRFVYRYGHDGDVKALKGYVTYNSTQMAFIVVANDGREYNFVEHLHRDDCEVVGNMIDNPELMEGKDTKLDSLNIKEVNND